MYYEIIKVTKEKENVTDEVDLKGYKEAVEKLLNLLEPLCNLSIMIMGPEKKEMLWTIKRTSHSSTHISPLSLFCSLVGPYYR